MNASSARAATTSLRRMADPRVTRRGVPLNGDRRSTRPAPEGPVDVARDAHTVDGAGWADDEWLLARAGVRGEHDNEVL